MSKKAQAVVTILAGLAVLFAARRLDKKMTFYAEALNRDSASAAHLLQLSCESLEQLKAMRETKLQDLRKYKQILKDMAKSKRAVYEAGISLQEEKRLLEKQLEIMNTYLELDEDGQKIHLMRGEQSLQSFSFLNFPILVFGEESRPMPQSMRIVSKERSARPERGKVEEVDGKLKWSPPETGVYERNKALGEYVVFTDGPLILHGPVAKDAVKHHESFPHLCAGLTLYSARKLYSEVYIGTKIIYKSYMGSPTLPPGRKK